MKKVIIGSLIAVGLASGIAYAHGNNWSGHMTGYGNSHHNMMGGIMAEGGPYNCPGAAWQSQDGINAETNQKYLEKTSTLRRKVHDLRFEYMEAYRNPSTTQETLANLRQQINDLHNQIFEISKELHGE